MVTAVASDKFYQRLSPTDQPTLLGSLVPDVLARYGLNSEPAADRSAQPPLPLLGSVTRSAPQLPALEFAWR